ncbi:ATP-binding protein [bacterium]|nr:ATP-binding protein [bacterium]
MSLSSTKNRSCIDGVKTGLFSKQEGAEVILQGTRHVHSSLLGTSDPCWKITQELILGKSLSYPWEIGIETKPLVLKQSQKRNECFEAIASTTHFGYKTQNRDRLRLILEELLSNSLYHAYKNKKEEDKYDRLSSVTLAPGEEVRVFFGENSGGLHVVVEDHGGSLTFDHFSKCFNRCVHQTKSHIAFDDKHAGAGIGLYLVFELASHLRISVQRGKLTRFSLWLANSNQFDPDSFSFNFFEE